MFSLITGTSFVGWVGDFCIVICWCIVPHVGFLHLLVILLDSVFEAFVESLLRIAKLSLSDRLNGSSSMCSLGLSFSN